MTVEDDDRSRDELLRINRELDAQLRELVRTQQRLFLSERQNVRHLACLASLTAFAIAAADLVDPADILGRAAQLVFEHFPFEQCLGFLTHEGRLVPAIACAVEGLEGESGARVDASRSERFEWTCPPAPIFLRSWAVDDTPGLKAALEKLGAVFGPCETIKDAPLLVLPLARAGREPAGLMLFRRVTRKLSFHEEFPGKGGMAFLELVARHVAVTISNAQLVLGLEASYVELEKTQATLVTRERLAALGELAAQVAHEVRNPLGAIFNAMSLLRPTLVKDPEGGRMLSILEEESSRINAIVSELLEFARPTSPTRHHEPLLPIVVAAIEGVQAAAPGTDIRVEAEADLPLAQIDARMLRHALVNLLTNAAQAADSTTPIRVRVSRERNALRVDVANEGPSIPPAMLDRVFEPFFTTKASGTGLGLSVVKRAMDAHGGEVRVSSVEGGSTVFTLLVPIG